MATAGTRSTGAFTPEWIEDDPHLFEVMRYTVLNPVRAGLCESPEDWRWSSHRAVLGLEPRRFVDVQGVLTHFGPTTERATANYAAFVAEGLDRHLSSVANT